MRNIDIYSNTMETRVLRRNAKENGKMLRIYALRRNAKERGKNEGDTKENITDQKGKEEDGGIGKRGEKRGGSP